MATGRNIVAFIEKDRESLALGSRHSRPSELYPYWEQDRGRLAQGYRHSRATRVTQIEYEVGSRVFSGSSFCLVYYPYFSVLQSAVHEQTRVFLFRGFFCKDFL